MVLNQRIRTQYGWVICAACTLLIFCTGGLGWTGFGAYQPFLIELGGISNTQSSVMLMIRTAAMFGGTAIANRILRLVEIRMALTFALFTCGTSFVIFGFASSYPTYCLAAILGGFAYGCGGIVPASVLILRWFHGNSGFAIGICTAATGISSLVASPFITYMTTTHSMRSSFHAEAVFVYCAMALIWLLIRNRPEDMNTTPITGGRQKKARVYAEKDAPAFIYITMIIGVFLFGFCNNYYPHVSVLYSTSGYSANTVAMLLSVCGIALAIGKCVYGSLADNIGAIKANSILYIMCAFGQALTCLADFRIMPVAFLSVSISGFSLAILAVSISIYGAEMATEQNYGKTVSRLSMASQLGSLVFGAFPGIIADRTGSYVPAFIIQSIVTTAAAILLTIIFSRLYKKSPAAVS